jgi:hypothetical protein
MGVNLYDYQIDALERIRNGSIVKGSVGSGKSLLGLVYFYEKVCGGTVQSDKNTHRWMEKPRNLVIITTAKKRDDLEWEKEAAKIPISSYPDTTPDDFAFTVDSWNNISKYTDVKGAFFIFDEQRLVGSGAWVKSFYKISRQNEWIMLSATPGDTWLDYIPVMVANGYYRNKTDFLQQHVEYDSWAKFPKVKAYHNTGKLVKIRKMLLVEVDYTSKNKRIVKFLTPEYDKEVYKGICEARWNPFTDEPIQNIAGMFACLRRALNGHISRVFLLDQVVEAHDRVIVFYNFDFELEILKNWALKRKILFAEWNGHRHESLPDSDRWVYFVQYTAGAEGWNCISTNVMFFYSLNYSWRLFEQSKGRIDRLNSPFDEVLYYIIRSNAPLDQRIWNVVDQKRTFNEYENRDLVSF